MSSEQRPSPQYLGYLSVFVFLCFLFYLFPEFLIFKKYGFAPVEHIVDPAAPPTLGAVLADLWADRAHVLNPMNNPLVRFFLVTTVVGVFYDRVKRYAPSTGERSGSGEP